MISVNNKAMENIVNKITEFYAKVVADENYKVKFEEILNGKDITEATDEQLEKIGEIAKELDYDITLEEAKEFIKEGEFQLSDEDLDAVAGGTNKGKVICKGEDAGVITVYVKE